MFWWILLGIVLLLVVFLFTPLGFSLGYDASGFHLLLLAGWIRIPVNFAKIWEWIQKLIDAAKKETPKKETIYFLFLYFLCKENTKTN